MAWINASFLWGLAALGLPLVIHLLRSRRVRPAALGTLRFLAQALRESRRYRRLRELLLLLFRLAALVMLASAFSRPFRGERFEPAVPGGRETVVLVDASGSMGGRTLGVGNFGLACEELERVRSRVAPGTHLVTGVFAHDVREWPAEPHCGGGTDFALALRWARQHLMQSSAGEKEVVIITDLQASGLPAAPLSDWPLDAPVDIVQLSPAGDWNVAVAGVRPSTNVFRPEMELVVALAAHGEPGDRDVQVTVGIEGHGTVTAAADPAEGVVRLPWEPAGPGLVRGMVQAETDDAYPLDDCRPFAFFLGEPVRAVLVDGDPGATPYQSETYFLEAALGVAPHETGASEFAVERREGLGALADVDLICLCNVGELAGAEIAQVAAWVRQGGGLVHFLGGETDEGLLGDLRRAGLMPGAVRGTGAASVAPVFDWETSHTALSTFAQPESGDLGQIVFREAFHVELDQGARALAWFGDGSPAVAEHELGAGRVLLVANPCDRDWTDWPQQPIFLPLVRELCHYANATAVREPRVERRLRGVDEDRPPGVYGEDPVTVIAAAAASEAEPAACTEETFRERLGIGAGPLPVEELARDAPPPTKSAKEGELWPWLVLALVVVLLVEGALADRILGWGPRTGVRAASVGPTRPGPVEAEVTRA